VLVRAGCQPPLGNRGRRRLTPPLVGDPYRVRSLCVLSWSDRRVPALFGRANRHSSRAMLSGRGPGHAASALSIPGCRHNAGLNVRSPSRSEPKSSWASSTVTLPVSTCPAKAPRAGRPIGWVASVLPPDGYRTTFIQASVTVFALGRAGGRMAAITSMKTREACHASGGNSSPLWPKRSTRWMSSPLG
jgi:hypothetical protein